MADIARRAGVAAITVSRALSDPSLVAPKTLARIRRAVRDCGYVKDAVAGSLSSQHTRSVGVVVPVLTNSIFADTLQGLAEVLDSRGYRLLIATSQYDPERERQAIEAFLERRVDAIALTGTTHNAAACALLRRAGIPLAEMWNKPARPMDCAVGFSNFEAARAMVRHLVARGYRNIAYVGGPTANNDRTRGRERGYLAGLREAGMAANPARIRRTTFEFEHGARAVADLVADDASIDAVFAASDVLAVGALLHCLRKGWRVPEQIALAGLDGSAIGTQLTPALTSIRFPRRAIGTRTAELLLARIDGVPGGVCEDLGFELLEGESA